MLKKIENHIKSWFLISGLLYLVFVGYQQYIWSQGVQVSEFSRNVIDAGANVIVYLVWFYVLPLIGLKLWKKALSIVFGSARPATDSQ